MGRAADDDATTRRTPGKAYLVGSGIASLAAAAYLIRDGGMAGGDITIFESGSTPGGALDGAGSADLGYVLRGGRMFEDRAYACTYDLLSFVPSLTDPSRSVLDEMRAFNAANASHARARLVRAGDKLDAGSLGLSRRDRLDLIRLMALPEAATGAKRIEDYFQPSFFTTNFWYLWATTFAFQPWHSLLECKRYLHRFVHAFPWLSTLAGVRRTPYNQYDALVTPIVAWLTGRGVRLATGVRVTDIEFVRGIGGKTASAIRCQQGGIAERIPLGPTDLVFVTLGSMVAGSTAGSMHEPPRLGAIDDGGGWKLWEVLAAANPEFGRPQAFNGDIDGSKWLSFTTTLRQPTFFDLMERFTSNRAGTGGLVTLVDSSWFMSVVLAYQPHFRNQPPDVDVFWGYGLFVDRPGDYVSKTMSECSGEEILVELLRHLRFDEHIPDIVTAANCVPTMMPYITSQFMPRRSGDRPPVVPPGVTNLAFIGQFCEMPDDVVFTVDYSVRSGQTAAYALLGLDKRARPVYKGAHDIRVLYDALQTVAA